MHLCQCAIDNIFGRNFIKYLTLNFNTAHLWFFLFKLGQVHISLELKAGFKGLHGNQGMRRKRGRWKRDEAEKSGDWGGVRRGDLK